MTNYQDAQPRQIPTWAKVLPILVLIGVATAFVADRLIGSDEGEREAVVPSGTVLIVALEHTVSTERNEVGDEVTGRVAEAYAPGGQVIIPEGAMIVGEVTHAEGGGRVAGAPELTMRFTRLDVDGESYDIAVAPFRVKGKNDVGESVAEIGGGAVAGGIVGGVVGGGSGIVKGALIGGAIGTGVAVATDGDDIVLPVGQALKLRLAEAVTVRYTPTTES